VETSPLESARTDTLVWRLGTTGLAFDDWVGPFYPQGLSKTRWIEFYSRRFQALELNTTFYATPTPDRIAAWTKAVPPEFRFSAKVGKHITHDAPLSAGVEPLRRFLRDCQPFGDSLAMWLLQFPPAVTIRDIEPLRHLLDMWRTETTGEWRPGLAVEFRHRSWLDDRATDLLREYGAARVGLDHVDCPPMSAMVSTGTRLYVRLVGKHGRFDTESHELFDPTPQLQVWLERIRGAITPSTSEVWVLFNNDFAGHGPATLRRFAKLAGIPLDEPAPPPRQKSLF
jgi:uncharacterized protein YecE (DUF72 family)